MVTDLSHVSTAELQAELSRREGVRTYVFGPEDYVYVADRDGNDVGHIGPAIVTINVD
jgi:hypothetical protein